MGSVVVAIGFVNPAILLRTYVVFYLFNFSRSICGLSLNFWSVVVVVRSHAVRVGSVRGTHAGTPRA